MLAVPSVGSQIKAGKKNLPKGSQKTGNSNNPYGLSAEMVQWMKEAALQQLKGCRVKGHSLG